MKVSLAGFTKAGAKADLFVAGYFKGEKDLKALRKIDPAFAKAAEAAISYGKAIDMLATEDSLPVPLDQIRQRLKYLQGR